MVAVADKVENERPVFPFTAIIGQEEMKLALQLNVIDPKIGGVMIMGDRGTGKSTTIRALADLLPDIQIIKNDPFNTNPVGLRAQGTSAMTSLIAQISQNLGSQPLVKQMEVTNVDKEVS